MDSSVSVDTLTIESVPIASGPIASEPVTSNVAILSDSYYRFLLGPLLKLATGKNSWYVGKDNVKPTRMTMIPTADACMFCENPSGETKQFHISSYDKLGFLTCLNESCMKIAKDFIQELVRRSLYLRNNWAPGEKAFSDAKVTVKSEDGTLNTDWNIWYNEYSISKGVSFIDSFVVEVVNHSTDMHQYIDWNTFIELNPPASDYVSVSVP